MQRGRCHRGRLAIAVAAVLCAAPDAASAHEVLHELAAGRATALRAYEDDGAPLAGLDYEVWSPADRERPWQVGRTDRDGWLAFVPPVAGAWRVRVVDPGGHGLDVTFQAGPGVAPAAAPASGLARAARPLVGVAIVAAIFGGLLLLRRRAPAGR